MLEAIRSAFDLLLSGDRYTYSVIALSLIVSVASLVPSIIIGIPIGLVVGSTRFAGKIGFLILVNAAMGLPPVVVGLFIFMLLRTGGVLGNAELLFTPTAMVIAQIPLAVPVIAGITMAAVAAVPKDARLQARALGATKRQELGLVARHVRPSVLAACISGFGITISEVGAILITGGNLLVGGRNYTRTMTTAIVQETRQGNFAGAVAFAIILLTIILIVNIFLTRLQTANR